MASYPQEKPPPYSPTPPGYPTNVGQPQQPPGYIPCSAPLGHAQSVPNYGATGPTNIPYSAEAVPPPLSYNTLPPHMPDIIIVGACPACRIGVLEDDYTCLGIFCAIFFFPLGILCCLALKNRRCSHCGAYFG